VCGGGGVEQAAKSVNSEQELPVGKFLNSKTMLTKILLTHSTKLNIAFKLTLAITPKLTAVHIKYI